MTHLDCFLLDLDPSFSRLGKTRWKLDVLIKMHILRYRKITSATTCEEANHKWKAQQQVKIASEYCQNYRDRLDCTDAVPIEVETNKQVFTNSPQDRGDLGKCLTFSGRCRYDCIIVIERVIQTIFSFYGGSFCDRGTSACRTGDHACETWGVKKSHGFSVSHSRYLGGRH